MKEIIIKIDQDKIQKIKAGITFFLYIVLIILFGAATYRMGYNSNIQPTEPEWFLHTNRLADRIKTNDVSADQHGLYIPGDYYLSVYSDTDSMIPIFDEGSTGISIKYNASKTLNVGDIIIYDVGPHNIAHRIVLIGKDEIGRYYITKGDNNAVPDPDFIRDEEVKRVMVGVLW